MLLSELRRLSDAPDAVFSVVSSGLDVGYYDREDTLLNEVEARVVEGTSLRAIPVTAGEATGFTAFLDGIQRAEVRLYHDSVPIVYAYGAAVVRRRIDRRMGLFESPLLAEREALFFPFTLLEPEVLQARGVRREMLRDTSDGELLPLFPPVLHARAAQAVNAWRESIERELAEAWCRSSSSDEVLLADGTLTISPEVAECPRAVGVIKSHRTRFFDGNDMRTVLGLRAGERTSVFEPLTRRFTPVHSWYLRLRPTEGHDVFWGLVRIETAAGPDSADRADRISAWLLNEVAPPALPDSRWDRLLYPIRDCEQFLRARAPVLHL